MERFLEYKGMYLNSYEWSGGRVPTPADNRKRSKMIKNGEAILVKHEDEFHTSDEPKKIKRKQ